MSSPPVSWTARTSREGRLRRAWLAAACLALALPRGPSSLRAEGGVAYKYQDWNETGSRVRVVTNKLRVEQRLPGDLRMGAEAVRNAISGQTPNGLPPAPGSDEVPLQNVRDRRDAVVVDVEKGWPARHNLRLGLQYAHSREEDYRSEGFALTGGVEFNRRNTLLSAGIAHNEDEVRSNPAFSALTSPADRRSTDVLLGLTQVLGGATTASLAVTWGRASGYLADPYRLIQQSIVLPAPLPGLPDLVIPAFFFENRPADRQKWVGLATWRHQFRSSRTSVEASWRHYRDDWGVRANTWTLDVFQPVGGRVQLQPTLRWHRQGAADFYRVTLDGAGFTPSDRPAPGAPFYSADYRLASSEAWTIGLKVIVAVREGLDLDLAWERYAMSGRDGVTSGSAFPDADIATVGLGWRW